jgi:hypothetical protein
MPLTKSVGDNMRELMEDNRKSGKERGAGGKPRKRSQMIAIALEAAREHGAKIPKKGER